MRVPVYLSPRRRLRTIEGESVTASFFAPFDRREEPYIRIATGDFRALRAEVGRDDALASFITSLSHEVVHYQQWVKSGTTSERGVAAKAVAMLRAYAKTVDHP